MAMAETDDDFSDAFRGLDAAFAAARAMAPAPSERLLSRVEADALRVAAARVAAEREAVRPKPAQPARAGFWRGLSEAIGGRRALAGLITATLAGVWLGFSPPTPLAGLTQMVSQSVLGSAAAVEGLDLIPTFDSVLNQG